ncbi:MAG TPA: hypothetical protein VIV11_06590 [Kofleriaceae bacterium]
MKWPHLCLVLTAACQSGDAKDSPANTTVIQLPKAQVTDGYRADITTLCDVIRLSGADQKPAGERGPMTAVFLGTQIKTPEAHEFIRAIKQLPAEAYAVALDHEAKRVGLAKCELANEWRAAAAGAGK